MCLDCGCEEGNERRSEAAAVHTHRHADGTVHTHSHGGPGHAHVHPPTGGEATRTVTLEQSVLRKNDERAAANRAWLAERGIVAVNLISSPGTGKTALLEKTLERLNGRVPCAVIAGDQQTDNDARRLEGNGAPVVQIETHSACHLDAERVGNELPGLVKDDTKLLLIENVGNLVCPAAFDLGEHFKVALLSTTEGEDKPLKYPVLFSDARVVVLTKIDLLPHLDWDRAACRRAIQRIQPGVHILELSARTGEGMDAWIDYLSGLVL
jgi:hydrogenase nickel incorporation protein HypB